MSAVGTMKLDTTTISLDAFRPYAEAVVSLQKLRDERATLEAALQEATRIASEADTQAIQAEGAALIGEGSGKDAQAARARFETAQAKVTDAQRRLRALREATKMQEQKVATLLREARAHVMQLARSLHEPVMQRAVAALRDAAEAVRAHDAIVQALLQAIGGVYGAIAQPRFPDLSFDVKQGGALLTGSVDDVVRTLREAGYDVEG